MTMFLTMIALAVATPAVAQTAPPPACTPEHAAMGHCTLQKAAPAADPHAGHRGNDACCEKAKAAGRKMDCCDKNPKAGHNGH